MNMVLIVNKLDVELEIYIRLRNLCVGTQCVLHILHLKDNQEWSHLEHGNEE